MHDVRCRMALITLVALCLALSCAPRQKPVEAHGLPTWVARHGGDDDSSEESADEKRGPSGAMKALDFWSAQRAYPQATISETGYGTALQQLADRRGRSAARGVTGVPAWEAMGPANVGGRTLCLALRSDDPDVLFAGSASGGLWKSTTGGVGADAWDYVDTGFPVLGVATIAIDPDDNDVMYIGTGEAYSYQGTNGGEVIRTTRGSYGVGILKSIDGGATWSKSLDWSYAQSRGVWMIRIHPTDGDVLYAATTEGVYKSIDAGASWDLVHAVVMAMDVRIHPTNPDKVFAAHGNFATTGVGIYRTKDGGQTWLPLSVGLPNGWTGKAQLAISETSPETVYASIADQGSGHGLYRSVNGGDSWSQVSSTNYAQYQGWYAHYVAVSPFDVDTLFTGGIEIWRSTDGGSTLDIRSSWQSVFFGTTPPEGPIGDTDYAHADHHFALWHPTEPNTVFFASDGGVFKTTDLGDTFQSLIGGYQTTQFYNGFSNSALNPDFAMGGLQDNFTVIYQGTNAWSREIGGDGTWTSQNPNTPTTIYGSAQSLQMARSFDSGGNWNFISPPSQSGDVTAFVAPHVLSHDDPTVLYAGRSRIYRSDNQGSNWNATNGGAQLSPGNPVLSLAAARTDVDVAYAGTAPLSGPARVFRTDDGGVSWTDVTGTLPDRYPSDISIDPNDPDRVLVTFMGFGTSHVFLSEDAGDSWDDIGVGLPDIPTSAVAVDPDYPEVVYVGTDLGTYVSLDSGATWQEFNDGMPLAMINDLKVFQPGRKMRAATHGNGAWQRDLIGPGNCAAPGEAKDLTLASQTGSTLLSWTAPLDPGVAPVTYDTLASSAADGFDGGASATCVEADGDDTLSTDASDPLPGQVTYYVIRPRSLCGAGPLGSASSGQPRTAPACS
ncbi:MAG: hypothetical protein GY716_18615 [bacterium]|nr:hypothetical protein [bacterium]